MAKLSILEIVSVALFISLILWHETSSSEVTVDASETEETTTTSNDRGCTGFKCPYYGRCVVDPDSDLPKCVCPPGCPKNLNAVCGSDNETYGNECMLESNACEKKINITVARYGTCEGSSCDGKTCPPGKTCKRNSEGEPECRLICPTICTLQYDPVCGSDGRTYGNRCAFDVEACQNDNITVAHRGECETDCAGIKCPNYGRCVIDDSHNRSMCVCRFRCPRIRRPVCGSDNQTYSNDCVLRSVSCETNTSITVLHKGECVKGGLGCETVLCAPGKHCVLNNASEPECVCTKLCPYNYRPICGSDNVTYPNNCSLLREACLTNTDITVLHLGRCEDGDYRCDQITCPTGKSCDPDSGECHCDTACPDVYAPVCASNGKTYGNRCEFDVAVCLYDDNGMTVVHDGPCSGTVTESRR